MASINKLKSLLNVSRGPSLKANYLVNIIPPISVITERSFNAIPKGIIAGVGSRNLSMLAVEASLPGKRIATTPHRMYGTIREMPYGALYDTIDITFMCTNIMIERAFFDMWQQYIIAPKSNYLNYYADYIGTIVIQKMDNSEIEIGSTAGELISIFTIEDAYPKVVQAQPLSYTAKNEILTLTVTFSYARWRSSLQYILGGYTDTSEVTSSSVNAFAATSELLGAR
jgi:hypothetical protein